MKRFLQGLVLACLALSIPVWAQEVKIDIK